MPALCSLPPAGRAILTKWLSERLSLPGPGSEGLTPHKSGLSLGDHFPRDSVIQDLSWVCSVGRLLCAFLGKEKADAALCIDQACVLVCSL